MSHNRSPVVCLVLLTLTTSAFTATRSSTDQAQAIDAPRKIEILRDKTRLTKPTGPWELATFKKSAPQDNERQLVDLIPKHVPLRIAIKKDKEAGFRDLNNEKWAREFELEVTNTGTKPIYSLYFHVWTEVKAASGSRVMFPLYYGRDELGDIRMKAEPTDVPIKPGESVSLDIHPGIINAWDYARKKENRPLPKHLEVRFQYLSFGDGTGYIGTSAAPLPRKTAEAG